MLVFCKADEHSEIIECATGIAEVLMVFADVLAILLTIVEKRKQEQDTKYILESVGMAPDPPNTCVLPQNNSVTEKRADSALASPPSKSFGVTP